MPIQLQGTAVKLSLSSADASGAGLPLVISDANGKTITLASYQRLIIDSLSVVVTGTTTADVTDPNATNNTLLGSFSVNTYDYTPEGEGVSLSLGTTPQVVASAAGAIRVIGAARIVEQGSTPPQGRASFRERLNS